MTESICAPLAEPRTRSVRSSARRLPAAASMAAALNVASCLLLAAFALVLCHGRFTYSFDDPYITLSLARRITEGTYGINPGQSASPSSSILYPLILAPFAALRVELLAPFLINAAAAAFTGAAFAALLRRAAPGVSNPRIAVLAVLLSFACGVVAAPLVGLEHGLHAALTAGAFLGLVRTLDTGRAPGWMVPALVALPLVRFEGLALEGLIVLALLLHRQWRAAAAAGAATVIALTVWGGTMHALGLPLLPSSVIVKLASEHHGQGGLLADLWRRLAAPRERILSAALLAQALAIALHAAARKFGLAQGQGSPRADATVAIVASGALAAHLAFAGMEPRYDIYVTTLGWCAIICLWGHRLRPLFDTWTRLSIGGLIVVGLEIGMVMWSLVGPIGSRGILEQQAQLRRLAVEFYRGEVAVNDLGLVSYGNPYGVLDLWGLGSEEARIARLQGRPNWMQQLAAEHHVGMAAIYTDWFRGQTPGSWIPIGSMTNRHGQGFDGGLTVDVYATSPATAPQVRAALTQLKAAAAGLSVIEVRPGR